MSSDVTDVTYEVFALRYGTHEQRVARENFLQPDIHDAPMPLDYYVWAIRGPVGWWDQRTIVIDTGFSPAVAARRPGRVILRPVGELLALAGIEVADVEQVVLTHMHWDHAGNMDLFPRAQFHIQDAEMAFCTGRCMCHRIFRTPMEVEDVVNAVRRVHDGRMCFHDGTDEIAPGVTLHLIGGHSGGLQAVRVPTSRGWVVLASDATHFWENIRTGNPFPVVVDVARMLEGYRIVDALADGPDHVIPGHDPLVRTRFPALPDTPEIVRLDLPPIA
jgi:glyoxylase-like metal-dependent hydrolase (beta-lactamase superfamily II)